MTTASFRLGLALLLAAFCSLVRAGVLNVPCDTPFVFRGASVNVVVLPFAMPQRDSPTANRIAQLVQREALRSIAKFGSVGSVQLTQTPREPCLPEVVRAQLLGEQGGAKATVEPGRGLVMVWGRIVESGDTLYSQVFVDFVRRGMPERLELPLADGRLVGTLSSQGFAGPQRRIDKALLQKIDGFAARNAVLYASPDEGSSRTSIPDEVPFYYYVTELRGDWMRVAAFTPDQPPPGQVQLDRSVFGGHQWMHAVAAEPEWTLRTVLPEMAFVEGVAGYLALRDAAQRAAPGDPQAGRAALIAAASRALDDYQENMLRNVLGGERELVDERYASARSVALELQAMLRLLPPSRSSADIRFAREKFAASSRLQPANADARNLTLMTDVFLAARDAGAAEAPLRSTDALLATLGVAPGNASVLGNLRVVYPWLLGRSGALPSTWRPLAGDERARIEKNLGALNEVTAPR